MKRSSPANPAMNAAMSSRPCIDSAASCSAAIHPSVRASSTSTSAGVDCQAHRLVEVGGGLVGGEAQVGGADLEQLAPGAQARQRQGRVGAAGDHQVDLRRQVLEQERHRLVDLRRLDDVVVVEHQDQVVVDGVQVVEQRRDDDVRRLPEAPGARAARRRRRREQRSGGRRRRRSRTARGRCRADRARARRSPGPSANHSATSVVLPNPAGADTSVSAGSPLRSSAWRSRGRATIPRRRRGACSFVSTRGIAASAMWPNYASPGRETRNGPRVEADAGDASAGQWADVGAGEKIRSSVRSTCRCTSWMEVRPCDQDRKPRDHHAVRSFDDRRGGRRVGRRQRVRERTDVERGELLEAGAGVRIGRALEHDLARIICG